jgi:hypothetical protein
VVVATLACATISDVADRSEVNEWTLREILSVRNGWIFFIPPVLDYSLAVNALHLVTCVKVKESILCHTSCCRNLMWPILKGLQSGFFVV